MSRWCFLYYYYHWLLWVIIKISVQFGLFFVIHVVCTRTFFISHSFLWESACNGFSFQYDFFFLESQSKGFECAADDNPTLGDFKFLLFKQKIHKIRIIDSTVTVRFYPVILGAYFLFVFFLLKFSMLQGNCLNSFAFMKCLNIWS